MRKITATMLLTIMTTLSFTFPMPKALADIYIRPTGEVEGTDKIDRDGDTYTFTANISDKIIIQKGNILVNGDGYQLQGPGSATGFRVEYVSKVSIKNTDIVNWAIGIRTIESSNNRLYGNTITNGVTGIEIIDGVYNLIFCNSITQMSHSGIVPDSYDTVAHNTVDNAERGIWISHACNYNFIKDNDVNNNDLGVNIGFAHGNKFYHNNFIDNTGQVYIADESVLYTQTWDDDASSGGNHWSDHSCTGNPSNGLQPYIINAYNVDSYPFEDPIVRDPALAVELTEDPDCEYYSDLDEPVNYEDLTISNFGDGVLTVDIDIAYLTGTDWLSIDGQQSISSASVPPCCSEEFEVEMDGTGLAKGLYQAEIQISHNDPAEDDPYVMQVDLFRADSFICAAAVVVTTPCLALEVSNVESFGRGNIKGGLWYYNETDEDSSANLVSDGSLTLANKTRTAEGPDTIVYRDIFSNLTSSNPGFRGLEYPKLSYNAATDESVASANQVSIDSTIEVNVRYIFPQNPDSCQFVRIKFRVSEYENVDPDLIIGAAVDFDCGILDKDLGGFEADYNLVYQQGTDTLPDGSPQTNKYVAGITGLTCQTMKRMALQHNEIYVDPDGGFSDQYIYEQLDSNGTGPSPVYVGNLHSVVAFEEMTTTPEEMRVYQFALVSSIAGEEGVLPENMPADIGDLMASVKQAWKKGFGWCTPWWRWYGDLELPAGDGEIGFQATGTHEDGINGGCCGCNFSYEIDPAPTEGTITLVDDGNCFGHLEFDGLTPGSYTVTLIVDDLCGDQQDVVYFEIEATGPACDCDIWGDVSGDGNVNPLDVVYMVNHVYLGNDIRVQHANCPKEAGDANCDGSVNPVDVVFYVNRVYLSQDMFCGDPCEE